jgi:hypothetical protein
MDGIPMIRQTLSIFAAFLHLEGVQRRRSTRAASARVRRSAIGAKPLGTAALLLCLASCAAPEGNPAAHASVDTPPTDADIARLVRQLGDENFHVREKAQEQIEALPTSALNAVKVAVARSTDAEIKRRGEQALEVLEIRAAPITQAELAEMLRSAVWKDNLHRLKWLIRLGAPVDTYVAIWPNRYFSPEDAGIVGKTIHWAASKNYMGVVEVLLAHGDNVNAQGRDGSTPLHWAAEENSVEVAEFLLTHSAEVNSKDSSGWTALQLAANRGHKNIAGLLLDHGADMNAKENSYSMTALHVATNGGHYDTLKLLLTHGADVNAKTNDGQTALHVTAQRDLWAGQKDMAELLLVHGADPHLKDSQGKTPLDLWPELAKIVQKVESEKAAKAQKP